MTILNTPDAAPMRKGGGGRGGGRGRWGDGSRFNSQQNAALAYTVAFSVLAFFTIGTVLDAKRSPAVHGSALLLSLLTVIGLGIAIRVFGNPSNTFELARASVILLELGESVALATLVSACADGARHAAGVSGKASTRAILFISGAGYFFAALDAIMTAPQMTVPAFKTVHIVDVNKPPSSFRGGPLIRLVRNPAAIATEAITLVCIALVLVISVVLIVMMFQSRARPRRVGWILPLLVLLLTVHWLHAVYTVATFFGKSFYNRPKVLYWTWSMIPFTLFTFLMLKYDGPHNDPAPHPLANTCTEQGAGIGNPGPVIYQSYIPNSQIRPAQRPAVHAQQQPFMPDGQQSQSPPAYK